MEKVCLLPSELRLGMYVCELDRAWIDSPFLFQGFPLHEQDEISQLSDLCAYVYVDKQRSDSGAFKHLNIRTLRSSPPLKREPTPSRPSPTNRRRHSISSNTPQSLHQVDQSLDKVRPIFFEARTLVSNALEEVRLGHSVDLPEIREAVAGCADAVIQHPDAMLLLSNLKDKDDYTAEHSLNVAVLSMVLGRHLDMPSFELEQLGVSALLHDVGKMRTPDEVLKKPDRLTDEEMLVMRQHPSLGTEILGSSHGISDDAIDVAHHHHERLNGSGYPHRLSESDISHFARIVSITDTFDAITSDRVYGSGRTNVEAFQILQASGGNLFQAELVSKLIHAIGVYTPGTVVQLRDGNYAVIVKINHNHPWRPVVMVLRNAQLEPLKPQYIDLSKAKPGHHIRKMVLAQHAGIDPHLFRWRGFQQFMDE